MIHCSHFPGIDHSFSLQFLTELTRLFQKCRTTGSVVITLKKCKWRHLWPGSNAIAFPVQHFFMGCVSSRWREDQASTQERPLRIIWTSRQQMSNQSIRWQEENQHSGRLVLDLLWGWKNINSLYFCYYIFSLRFLIFVSGHHQRSNQVPDGMLGFFHCQWFTVRTFSCLGLWL